MTELRFKVGVVYGVHQEGTKDYTVVTIRHEHEADLRTGLVFKIFGKVDATNPQVKIEKIGAGQMESEVNKALGERRKKGYSMKFEPHVSGMSIDGVCRLDHPRKILKLLPASVLKRIELAHVRWLDNSLNLEDMPGAGGLMAHQRGATMADMEAANRLKREQDEERQRQERLASEEELKSNPLFGMF